MITLRFVISDSDSNTRTDSFLSDNIDGATRNFIQNLIDDDKVLLNGKAVKAGKKLKQGDVLEVEQREAVSLDIKAENISLDIIYEDEYLAVINKPQGLIVHPANNIVSGTLVNALLYHLKDLSGINGILRPGIVHRIDKDTSGLLVVAKNDLAHSSLATQIQSKECKRYYLALTEGVINSDNGEIDKPIGRSNLDRKKMAVDFSGRNAVTLYKVLERFNENTFLECELKTGRTHQIRVHLKSIGYPIVGDLAYGFKKQKFNLNGQLLHAYKLQFCHPKTGEVMTFNAPLPNYFEKILKILRDTKKE